MFKLVRCLMFPSCFTLVSRYICLNYQLIIDNLFTSIVSLLSVCLFANTLQFLTGMQMCVCVCVCHSTLEGEILSLKSFTSKQKRRQFLFLARCFTYARVEDAMSSKNSRSLLFRLCFSKAPTSVLDAVSLSLCLSYSDKRKKKQRTMVVIKKKMSFPFSSSPSFPSAVFHRQCY